MVTVRKANRDRKSQIEAINNCWLKPCLLPISRSAWRSMSSLPKADQLYRCLTYPHCGLRLALGQTYSRQQLEDGCEGNAVMLNKLIEKLKNGSILEPIGAWIDSVDDCLAARNVLEFFLLSHGGQASVNDAQQALTTYGCQLSVQSLIKSHCILDGEHVILPGPITPLCEASATTIAKSLFKPISEEALKRAGDRLNALSLSLIHI